MANYNKAFNFRGGFQVDTDVLVVRGQNVGIGSSIPNERLVVDGIIQANGLNITSTEDVVLEKATAGILTVTEILDVGIETGSALPYPDGTPQVRLTTGIITAANPAIGVVTYYGDGGRLLNLPTSQWLDIDVGLGFTSIYAQGYVGVNTTDPRYVFQVGGVPFAPKAGFNTSQTGVGIETGSIFVSDNISVGKTVSTLGEFIGVGSLITDLNGSALKYGTIGSDRFENINALGTINAGIISAGIITVREQLSAPVFIGSTIIGDTFSGIAQTAVGVVTTAQLVFDTAEANEYNARNRFISTEGVLQIGNYQRENVSAGSSIGDVDVYKFSESAYIYSLAKDGVSKVFVGREREGSSRREFGGLRYGGSLVDGTSDVNDLDVVNYDVGNLNFYLHSGSGGINDTEGSFRWIYGQSDSVLAELDKNGGFVLSGNALGEATLDVTGIATFRGDTYVNGELTVEDKTTLKGDIAVEGTIQVDGGFEASVDVQFKGADFSDGLTVAGGVFDGDEGVGLTSTGKVEASSEINLVGAGSTVVTIKADGTISADSTIQSNTNIVGGLQVSSPRVNATTEILAPDNFLANVNGLSVDNANIDNLGVSSLTATDATVGTAVYVTEVRSNNGNVVLTSSNVNASSLSGNDLTVTDASVNGTIDIGGNSITQTAASIPTLVSTAITATTVTAENVIVSSTLDAPNFSSSGAVSGTEAVFDFARITDLETVGVATFGTINASVANIGNLGSVAIESVSADQLIVSGVATVQSIDILSPFTPSQIVTPKVDADEVDTDEIRPLNGSIVDVFGDLSVSGDTTLGVATISELTVNGVRVRTPSSPDTTELSFNINSGVNGTNLTITVNYQGQFLTTDLPLT